MALVSFEATKDEYKLASKIAARAVKLAEQNGLEVDYNEMQMDVVACHANGCPLDLARLLDSPDSDFVHDVFGIRKYINRKTGTLRKCFVPRAAKPEGGAT